MSEIPIPEGMTLAQSEKIFGKWKEEKKSTNTTVKAIEKAGNKEIRISHDFFRGRELLSLRSWYLDADSGEMRPGKGCTFDYEDIDEIVEGLEALKTHLEENQ